jgi:hypothetical protein
MSPDSAQSCVLLALLKFVTGQRHQQDIARMEAERRVLNGQQGLIMSVFHSSTLKSNGIFPNAV